MLKNELEMMWKEKFLAWFKVPSQHLPGGTDEKYETPKSGQSLS
jgi:hypothetical protein